MKLSNMLKLLYKSNLGLLIISILLISFGFHRHILKLVCKDTIELDRKILRVSTENNGKQEYGQSLLRVTPSEISRSLVCKDTIELDRKILRVSTENNGKQEYVQSLLRVTPSEISRSVFFREKYEDEDFGEQYSLPNVSYDPYGHFQSY
ncbi:uncharacterized protein O3C94_013458 [Discoglossus pictus]